MTPESEVAKALIGRRLARFRVTPQALLRLGRGTFEVTDNELPADVQLVCAYYDEAFGAFVMVIESEKFPAFELGVGVLEVSPPVIRAIPELGAIA